jgi:uncharacterized phage infection (PIP) family protein YhgE
MKKQTQKGFSLLGIIFILGLIAFASVYKDKDGKTYLQKGLSGIQDKKEDVLDKANNAKKQLEDHDKELGKIMEGLE